VHRHWCSTWDHMTWK